VLYPLYDQHTELFSLSEWKQLCEMTFRQLEGRLQDTTLAMGSRDTIRDHIAAIPNELVDNYWSIVSRFLFVENTNTPDYYALQRLVKYLKSPLVVKNMLHFFTEHSEFLGFVQGNNKRWFEFFKQASQLPEDTLHYHHAVEKVYFEKSTRENPNLAIYEMAKLFVYGCELNFTQKGQWFEAICTAQNYQGRSLDEFQQRIEFEINQLSK
jgi:hypothetical protein